MRLTAEERDTITAAIARHFHGDTRVVLFGSRAEDRSRGGDIDLFLETDRTDARDVLRRKLALVAELHERLGDQRIDVVSQRKGGPRLAIHQAAVARGGVVMAANVL